MISEWSAVIIFDIEKGELCQFTQEDASIVYDLPEFCSEINLKP